MNYIDYTKAVIKKYAKPDNIILIIGAGFSPKSIHIKKLKPTNIITHDGKENIDDWCEKYKNKEDFRQVDLVILSRVLEHFPVRHMDWYLYQIYTLMAEQSTLVCVVPDMPAVAKQLQNEFSRKQIDYFKINRLTFELLSGGNDVKERHALWTLEESVRYYLEMEKLFEVESVRRVEIDTGLVPQEIEFIAKRI